VLRPAEKTIVIVIFGVTLSSISIESGNDIFVIENGGIMHVMDRKFIRNVSESSKAEIASNIAMLSIRH
jgi:hypothetical protein